VIDLRLIIVDDDLQTVEVIRDSISWGVFGISDIEIAYNVAGAQKLFEEKVPDIVICDIEMPKGSGIDLIKWVREKEYKSEFIFLTCHESFEFASIALNYNASSYITKPFNIEKTEMAISKASEKIRKENYFKEYSEYGQYWVENKILIVESFWRELLFFSIPSKASLISDEISKRKLSLNVNDSYHLVLLSVFKSEIEGKIIDDQSFEYALRKLSSEVILGELYFEQVIHYVTKRNHYVAIVVPDTQSEEQLKVNCMKLIETCEKYLKCSTTCYVGKKAPMNSLAQTRVELEEMDQGNIASKNKIFMQGEQPFTNANDKYVIDTELISELLETGEKIQIVNNLKRELEGLTAENKLDAYLIYSIHQDFMQALYAFLYKKEIQAHKLFSDKISQKLHANADNSMFDMLKWVSYVTNKTIDYVKEVGKSQTIIDKAKQYIQDHYKEEIGRNEVSAMFFLTSDYLAKMFKAETGVTIKEYVNNYRIEKAKDLLRNSNASISMIAAEVGFDNFSYFSTLFKKLTGTGPQTYRKEFEK
jgi:two-component system, response regulator YesN